MYVEWFSFFNGFAVSDVLWGALAGVMSGVPMVLISDFLYRLKVFKSSLLLIDGSFFLTFLKITRSYSLAYSAGIPIHILTSASFGAAYIVLARVLRLDTFALSSVSLYAFALWLAMIFIALPIAGQGIMGRRIHSSTWFEQLVLHIVFAASFFTALKILF